MGAQTKSRRASKVKVNLFHQKLGRLTYYQACQLLGEEGATLIQKGRAAEIDTAQHVYLGGDLYRVNVPSFGPTNQSAIASITLSSDRHKQLKYNCELCEGACIHVGAAIYHLLDAKATLGLAEPPDETVPLENLTESELRTRMLAERQKRASEEPMIVRGISQDTPWTDYVVTSQLSGRSYRVALRGLECQDAFCSCPDFRTNHLGTCKHIMRAMERVQKKFTREELRKPYERKRISVGLNYLGDRAVRFHLPRRLSAKAKEILSSARRDDPDPVSAMALIQALENAGQAVHVYPDAAEFIQSALVQQRLASLAAEVRKNPAKHAFRSSLLKVELLPYQLDGVAFAVGAGRAILADDMGLGKTIQGIGVAELLAQWADIRRVLIVCPASLKSQWLSEIQRFSNRSVQLILGSSQSRPMQYANDSFFTVCNYEQVCRDVTAIEETNWDLIILDEGQRIKNWESRTSQVIRMLQSRHALILSGTPLENRLEELFTVVKFADEARLGSAYQFFHRHRVVDDNGRILGYQKLDELRKKLAPILLRRRRDEVAKQLPERTDEIIRILPTEEQAEIHEGAMRTIASIIGKSYFTEMDLLRLRCALQQARMVCNSTYLIDEKEPEFSSKLARMRQLLSDLCESPSNKIILFSEWKRMLDRVEVILGEIGAEYVRLDGSVPQKKRQEIVHRFQSDPNCKLILMTNAGSTGLNLQKANIVINADLPWNPAVLEQRIGRAHRMGQKKPVHVYNLVTEGLIEEKLLTTLAAKQELADASLDLDSEVEFVEMQSGMEELRRRLEVILQPKLLVPVDESLKRRVEDQAAAAQAHRERVSAAGGELLGAALKMVSEMVGGANARQPDGKVVDALQQSLEQCAEKTEGGGLDLRIRLENADAVRTLAQTLAALLSLTTAKDSHQH